MVANELPSRNSEESGSIGIGAMIVFIALILVAAVASTIIIKTAEELQQNAESTSQDTREQISGKVSISDVFVKTVHETLDADNSDDATGTATDINVMTVIARVSSGSLNVQQGDISYYVTCKVSYWLGSGGAGEQTTTYTTIDAGTVAATDMGGTAYTTGEELPAGTSFRFDMDLTPTDNNGDYDIDADDFKKVVPGCDAFAGAGDTLELRIVVDGGGETLATLKIPTITIGESLI